jgi:hypothetical protein
MKLRCIRRRFDKRADAFLFKVSNGQEIEIKRHYLVPENTNEWWVFMRTLPWFGKEEEEFIKKHLSKTSRITIKIN